MVVCGIVEALVLAGIKTQLHVWVSFSLFSAFLPIYSTFHRPSSHSTPIHTITAVPYPVGVSTGHSTGTAGGCRSVPVEKLTTTTVNDSWNTWNILITSNKWTWTLLWSYQYYNICILLVIQFIVDKFHSISETWFIASFSAVLCKLILCCVFLSMTDL